jgi:hypothetical protein
VADDAVDSCEAKAGPAPWRLGGEERLEDPLTHLGAHPAAGVGHRQLQVGAGGKRATFARGELAVAGAQAQLAAGGHRVAGVDRQVQQDLLQLAGVDAGRPRRRCEIGRQPHVFADDAPQHPLAVADDAADLQHDRSRMLTRKRQELAGELAGALRGDFDFAQVVADR